MSDYTLQGWLKLNASQFEGALKKSTVAVKGAATEAAKAGSQMGSALTSAAGALATFGAPIAVISAGLKDAINRVSELKTTADQFGTSTTDLQQWQYVFTQSGVEADKLSKALMKVVVNRDDALKGNAESIELFRSLGISMETLKGQGDIVKLFEEAGKAIGKIEDPLNRAAAAEDLFGMKNAKLLVGFSSGNFERMKNDLGAFTINESMTSSLDETGDMWDRLYFKARNAVAITAAYATDLSLIKKTLDTTNVLKSQGEEQVGGQAAAEKKADEETYQERMARIKREKKEQEDKAKRIEDLTKRVATKQQEWAYAQMSAEQKLAALKKEQLEIGSSISMDQEEQLMRQERLFELSKLIAAEEKNIAAGNQKAAEEFGKVSPVRVGGWQSIGGFNNASGLAAALRDNGQREQINILRRIERATTQTANNTQDGGENW